MAINIKHKFTSPAVDDDDPNVIKPSNWNDSHDITLAANKLIGRASSGEGPAEEIDCTAVARQVLAAANAAAIRVILELGGAALLNEASASDFLGAVASKLLSAKNVWDAAEPVSVDYDDEIVLDFSAGINFEITLEGSPLLGEPINLKPGQSGIIIINTNGPDRSIAYHSIWKAHGGPLDISSGDTTDYMFYFIKDTSNIIYSILRNPS